MANKANLEVYEQALVVTVFAVFFPLMFSSLNDNFIPSEVVTPLWLATVYSAIAVVTFTVLCFLVFFYYLHLLYGRKLKATWKSGCRFSYLVARSGRRTLAVGGAPLGLFYAEAFVLYSILGGAFAVKYSYTWAALLYFASWAFSYILELYCGRKKSGWRLPLSLAVVCIAFLSLMIALGALGIVNPK